MRVNLIRGPPICHIVDFCQPYSGHTWTPCSFPSINSPFPQSRRQTAGLLVRRTSVRLRATPCFPWSCRKLIISELETFTCAHWVFSIRGWALVLSGHQKDWNRLDSRAHPGDQRPTGATGILWLIFSNPKYRYNRSHIVLSKIFRVADLELRALMDYGFREVRAGFMPARKACKKN